MSEIFAVVKDQAPIFADVVRVFGGARIPLVDERLVRGNAPGMHDELFFKVDWRKLTEDQIAKWSKWMARRFNLSVDDVLLDMRRPEHGIPILACYVSLEPEGTKAIYPGNHYQLRKFL